MANIQTTFDQIFDDAIDTLPWLRKRIVTRHFRKNPDDKQDCCERALLACCKHSELQGFAAKYESGELRTSSAIELDPDTLKKWLDLIIEYLPKILAIILPLFQLIVVLLAVTLFAGVANAQDCPNGLCPLVRSSVARVVNRMAPPPIMAESVTVSTSTYVSRSSPIITQSTSVRANTRHWSYPSNIADHLLTDHGQSVAGLSREQMLTLHDQLHQSGTVRSRTVQTYRTGFFQRLFKRR